MESRLRQTGEWHPTTDQLQRWGMVSIPVLLGAAIVYATVASRGRSSSFTFTFSDTLIVAAAAVAVFLVHEGVHGVFMACFGAKPQFGVTALGGSILGAALYTTAPGHVFWRRQYLVVILAPTVLMSAAGLVLCLSAAGGLMWLPFALHATGCVGDVAIARRVLREPPGTRCEDLRDGVRFWSRAE